jgi:hypothetical protein
MPERRPDIEAALADPENNYLCWRQLPDGSYAAMARLLFTTAIMLDVDVVGYANRFCFACSTGVRQAAKL